MSHRPFSSKFKDRILKSLPFTIIRKARSVNPSHILEPSPALRGPPTNLLQIYAAVEHFWLIQEILRVLKQEALRPSWVKAERFKARCDRCSLEIQETTDKCPKCGGPTRKPNLDQYIKLDNLLRNPNDEDKLSFGDILASTIHHDGIADDWYIAILFRKNGAGELEPTSLEVQDTRFIKVYADDHNRLGVDEYFCPVCYEPDTCYSLTQAKSYKMNCPKCGLELQRTAYVQIIGSQIKNRWSTKMMVHGSTGRVLPALFGRPKPQDLWEPIHIIKAMDEYNRDVYTEGHVGKIIILPGYSREDIQALKIDIQTETTKLDQTTISGELRPKKTLRTLFLGTDSDKPGQVLDSLPPPEQMQSLSFYSLHVQAICGLYGVVPLFINLNTGGEGRANQPQPTITLEVQNRTIKEIHRDLEEVLNEQLLPLFGIHDWIIRFGQIETKDMLRDAQVYNYQVTNLVTLRNAGIDAQFDENGKIVILSYPPIEQGEAQRRIGPTLPQKPKISESTGAVIEGTTRERHSDET